MKNRRNKEIRVRYRQERTETGALSDIFFQTGRTLLFFLLLASTLAGCAKSPGAFPAKRDASRVSPPALTPATTPLAKLTPAVVAPSANPPIEPLSEELAAKVTQAENLILQDRPSLAMNILKTAQEEAPRNPRILSDLGQAYAALSQHENAIESYRQSLDAQPDDVEIHFAIAREYLANGQDEPAILALRTGLSCPSATGENLFAAKILLLLAEQLEQQGYYQAALDAYQELTHRAEQHGSLFARDESLQKLVLAPETLWVMQAKIYRQLGQNAKAADLLGQAIQYNRSDHELTALLFDLYLQEKDFAQAEDLLVTIAEDANQQLWVAKLARQLGQLSDDPAMPMRLAKRLAEKGPLYGKTAAILADAASQKGQLPEAIAFLEAYLEKSPSDEAVIVELARLYTANTRHKEALLFLIRILANNPEASDVVTRGIKAMLTQPTPADMEKNLPAHATEVNEKDLFAFYYVTGQLADIYGDRYLAAEQYRKSLFANPLFLPAYENLARIYLAEKDKEKLDNLVSQARVVAPDSHLVPYLSGLICHDRGQYEKAAAYLIVAKARRENHLPTLLLLARSLAQTGRLSESAETLGEALRIDPENEQTYRMLYDLFVNARQYPQAERIVEALLQRNPYSQAGKLMEAELAFRTGHPLVAKKIIDELKRTDPQSPAVNLLEIQLELASGTPPLPQEDRDRLSESLCRMIIKYPDFATPKQVLLQMLNRQNDPAYAVSVWGQLYTQSNQDPTIGKAYAAALLRDGEPLPAIPVLQGIVEDEPRDLQSQRALIQTLIDTDQPDLARKQADKVQAVLDEWLTEDLSTDTVEMLSGQKLRIYAQVKEYGQLAAYGQKLVALKPNDEVLKKLLLSMLAQADQPELIHSLLDRWIANPANQTQKDLYRQAKLNYYYERKQTPEAISFVEKWIQEEPQAIEPRMNLVALMVDDGQYDQAQTLVDEWVEQLTPEPPPPPTTLPATQPASQPTTQPETQPVTLPATLPETQPATAPVVAVEPAVVEPQPNPLLDWAREYSVRLLVLREKYPQAIEQADRYLEDQPKNVQLWLLKSSALSEIGQMDQAIQAMKTALEIDPDNASIKNNLGYMYADMGINLDEAERLVRHALAQNAQQTTVQDSLGWVFYKQGRLPQAARVFDVILAGASSEKPPEHPLIWDHAGDTFWRLGRKDDAIRCWQKAVEQCQTQPPSSEIRKVESDAAEKLRAVEAGQPPAVAPLGEGVTETPPPPDDDDAGGQPTWMEAVSEPSAPPADREGNE